MQDNLENDRPIDARAASAYPGTITGNQTVPPYTWPARARREFPLPFFARFKTVTPSKNQEL